jgi:NAD(P)-dependent dehydrogenase (short-subunit alcohol dehydrogenase family)
LPTLVISGSNRGMGLQWVRHYLQQGWRIYATCRFPDRADELNRLAATHDNLSVHRLDVSNPIDTREFAAALVDTPVDLLINNAGVYFEQWGKDPLGTINYNDWQQTFNVNTLGAMRLSEALIHNIAASEKRLIVTITSHMGSIADITSPSDYAYRSSKAALNAAMKGLSFEAAKRDVGVLLLHPGWVRTRMGGDSAPLGVAESVSGMSRLVDRFKPAQNGCFFRYDGIKLPW